MAPTLTTVMVKVKFCSKVAHSLADYGSQTYGGISSRSLPTTSSTCNFTFFTAGVINQSINKELLSKTEKIYGPGANV